MKSGVAVKHWYRFRLFLAVKKGQEKPSSRLWQKKFWDGKKLVELNQEVPWLDFENSPERAEKESRVFEESRSWANADSSNVPWLSLKVFNLTVLRKLLGKKVIWEEKASGFWEVEEGNETERSEMAPVLAASAEEEERDGDFSLARLPDGERWPSFTWTERFCRSGN